MFLKILNNLCYFIFSLFLISLFIFLATDILPGDTAQFILGTEASIEKLQALRSELQLDLTWYQRYIFWIKNLLQGDLGKSYTLNLAASDIFKERLSITLPLIISSLVLSLLLAYFFALLAVYFQHKWQDWGIMALLQSGLALPSFWVASIFIVIFAVQLNWFPAGNFKSWNFSSWISFWQSIKYFILPVITLTLPQLAIFSRIIRSSLLDTQNEDFVKTAQSKGITKLKILISHILPYAQIPIITIISLQIAFLITGAIIIEQVFYLPGMGRLILQTIYQRDLIILRNSIFLLLVFIIILNLLAQLVISILNPENRNLTNPLKI